MNCQKCETPLSSNGSCPRCDTAAKLPVPGQIVDDRQYLGNGGWMKLNMIPK